jgi:hypothetical protein
MAKVTGANGDAPGAQARGAPAAAVPYATDLDRVAIELETPRAPVVEHPTRTRTQRRRQQRRKARKTGWVEQHSEASVFVCTGCASSLPASPSEIVRHFRDAHDVAPDSEEIAEVLRAATAHDQRRTYRRKFLAEQRKRLAAWERAHLDGSPVVYTHDKEDAAWRQWISAGAPGLGRVARRLKSQGR